MEVLKDILHYIRHSEAASPAQKGGVGSAMQFGMNTGFNFIGTLSRFLTTAVLSIIAARMLGTVQYGIYSIFMWVVTAGLLLSNLGLHGALLKYVSEFDPVQQQLYIKAVLRFITTINIILLFIVSLILIFLAHPLSNAFTLVNIPPYVFQLAGVMLWPMAITQLNAFTLSGLQRFFSLMLGDLLAAVLTLITVLLVLSIWHTITAYILTLVGVRILVGAFYSMRVYQALDRSAPLPLPPYDKNRIVHYTGNISIKAFLDEVVWGKAEVVFLGLWTGAAASAFYSVSQSLVAIVFTTLPATALGVLFPKLSRMYGEKNNQDFYSAIRQGIRYLLILVVPIIAGIFILGKSMLILTYGKDFSPAANALKLLGFAAALNTIASPLQLGMLASEKQGRLTQILVAAAIANLALDFTLIPRIGLMGGAIGSTVGQTLAALGVYASFRADKSFKFPYETLWYSLIASLGMSLVVYLVHLYLPYPWNLFLGLFTGMAVYTGLLILLGAFDEQDRTLIRAVWVRLAGRKMKNVHIV